MEVIEAPFILVNEFARFSALARTRHGPRGAPSRRRSDAYRYHGLARQLLSQWLLSQSAAQFAAVAASGPVTSQDGWRVRLQLLVNELLLGPTNLLLVLRERVPPASTVISRAPRLRAAAGRTSSHGPGGLGRVHEQPRRT